MLELMLLQPLSIGIPGSVERPPVADRAAEEPLLEMLLDYVTSWPIFAVAAHPVGAQSAEQRRCPLS